MAFKIALLKILAPVITSLFGELIIGARKGLAKTTKQKKGGKKMCEEKSNLSCVEKTNLKIHEKIFKLSGQIEALKEKLKKAWDKDKQDDVALYRFQIKAAKKGMSRLFSALA